MCHDQFLAVLEEGTDEMDVKGHGSYNRLFTRRCPQEPHHEREWTWIQRMFLCVYVL